MKNLTVKILLNFVFIGLFIAIKAQFINGFENLEAGKLPAISIGVTYDKTTHLIFPSAIRYVDLGSENLVAGKAEEADNVLRIKANHRDFINETNFSVITDDGKFYSFDVNYEVNPRILNIDVSMLAKYYQKRRSTDVLFKDLGKNPPSLIGLIMESLYRKDKTHIRHLGSKSFGIRFMLKGLYIHQGKFYFHTNLQNDTHVPFRIDFVSFRIVDKRLGKRTVIQEKFIKAQRIYKTLESVRSNSSEKNIFLLDQFTLAEDKVLIIEVFEKNGGRHQLIQLENSDLINAKLIKDLHLKIN